MSKLVQIIGTYKRKVEFRGSVSLVCRSGLVPQFTLFLLLFLVAPSPDDLMIITREPLYNIESRPMVALIGILSNLFSLLFIAPLRFAINIFINIYTSKLSLFNLTYFLFFLPAPNCPSKPNIITRTSGYLCCVKIVVANIGALKLTQTLPMMIVTAIYDPPQISWLLP